MSDEAEEKTEATESLLDKRVVIIGAGACGLGAAWRLNELGHKNWLLLERSGYAGGLGTTVRDKKGFLWDLGGHVLFSHFEYFTKLLDIVLEEDEWIEHQREAWIWMREQFIPYPLQHNLWRLPKVDLWKCLDGLLQAERFQSKKKPDNFRDWLLLEFGPGLMEVFLDPYNKKVWAYPPEDLNSEWVGMRSGGVDLRGVLANVVFQRDSFGWDPSVTFKFPLHGGSGTIWKRIYERLPSKNIRFGSEVINVNVRDPENKFLVTRDGEKINFDYLINSMPLDILCRVCDGLGKWSREDRQTIASHFKHSSTHIIGLGIRGKCPERLFPKGWLYFPESDCTFYRANIFSNYSPNNVPQDGNDYWQILLERSESVKMPGPQNSEEAIQEAIEGCILTKLLTEDDEIASKFHIRIPYGYPTPFRGREALCRPLFTELEAVGILTRGRFGAWKYEISNQDHATMMGVEAVDHLLFGSFEQCFNMPFFVNQQRDSKTVRMLTKTTKKKKAKKTAGDANKKSTKDEESKDKKKIVVQPTTGFVMQKSAREE